MHPAVFCFLSIVVVDHDATRIYYFEHFDFPPQHILRVCSFSRTAYTNSISWLHQDSRGCWALAYKLCVCCTKFIYFADDLNQIFALRNRHTYMYIHILICIICTKILCRQKWFFSPRALTNPRPLDFISIFHNIYLYHVITNSGRSALKCERVRHEMVLNL